MNNHSTGTSDYQLRRTTKALNVSYTYNAEGDSWIFKTEITCSGGNQNVGKLNQNVIVTYDYAVETTTNNNIQFILQKLEFDMLKVSANELCRNSNIQGVYSSLPVDKTAGK
jgi:hypothetical protein